MMPMRRTPAAMLLLAVACGGKDAAPVTPPLPVTVTPVGPIPDGRNETRYGGAIEADASVDVAFRVSGVVDEVTMIRGADGRMRTLQEGDQVRRGAVLARLRQSEYRDQLSDAEAGARQAQADYERAAQLYENRSVSKADYDAAFARYSAGKARQSQAAISLGDATLRAPIDGVILRRAVDPGSLAGPSAVAFTLADTRAVKVVFGVPDVVVSQLKLGGSLSIQAEAVPGQTLQGRITRISPSADPNSRVFEIEATLPNRDGRMKVGMLASLVLGEAIPGDQLFLPLAAVIRPASGSAAYAVFVVRDSAGSSRAALRSVTLGETSGNLIAVTSGVAAGEKVIVRGATIVADGQPVRIIP